MSAGKRAVFVGDEILAVQCAVEARQRGIEPCLVVSDNPQVLELAADADIASCDRREVDLATAMDGVDADVLFTIAYEHIVPAAVLERVDLAVNFHDGPLPRYGGLNVTTWSLLHGEPEHGITWHLMTELADRGDILHEVRFDVGPDETAFSLNARCFVEGLDSFGTVADMIVAGPLRGRSQTEDGRRMYRRHERPCVVVDANVPAAELARAVRALDVGPRTVNSLGAVRWLDGTSYAVVTTASSRPGDGPVGHVARVDAGIEVQTVDGVLVVTGLNTPEGDPIDLDGFPTREVRPDDAVVAALRDHDAGLARAESRWRDRLSTAEAMSFALDDTTSDWSTVTVPLDGVLTGEAAVVTSALWCDGVSNDEPATVSITDAAARDLLRRIPFLAAPMLDVGRDPACTSVAEFADALGERVTAALSDGPFLPDLIGRDPALSGRSFDPTIAVHTEVDPAAADGSTGDGIRLVVRHRTDGSLTVGGPLDPSTLERIAGQLAAIATAVCSGVADVRELPLVAPADLDLIAELNDTEVAVPAVTLDQQFWTRCDTVSGAAAVSAGGVTLTYDELAEQVAAMASVLTSRGIGRGDPVGIALDRGVDMVVSVLATISIGAHYLPLDPTYPSDRLEFMVADSATSVVVAAATPAFDVGTATVVDPAERSDAAASRPAAPHDGADLAYLIYTSGSTGKPKGVQLEHREVVNFFEAMDAVIDFDELSVWLAATSLSFDISVLELLWTLTRGLHVVIQSEAGYGVSTRSSTPARARTAAGTMSLFYFAADEAQAASGYRLLLESARWADRRGFEALWTPERHFHEFGAPYPNPSVVSAALAVATNDIRIRAGSVVLPLHSPVRVAEEWAIVDNLSGGRVGISFASGWQPNDFVLKPDAYATARDSLPGLVDTVQRLWRGETVDLPGHDGSPVPVTTKPKPIQAELPTWITSAGSPSTFERAGQLGANVLTHLLGQTAEQLRENVGRYRAAWHSAGHPGEGRVTLMLHTFLDDDPDHARDVAREPLKGYLGTAVGLLKNLASAFPTFHRAGQDADEAFRSLTDEEMSQLLDLATERYLTTSGLFGTVDDAIEMVDDLYDAGVDEIACLVDFGIDDDLVLGALDLLGAVHDHVEAARAALAAGEAAPSDVATVDEPVDDTFADLVERYGVTHFQCTPSLASMLLASPADRAAVGRLRHMLVGGEALPLGLANELRSILPGRLTNMYGPTETTIWSLVHELDEPQVDTVPIGRPIANTTIHILDDLDREVPVGVHGELYIGGLGLARGYHDRPELTAERFREFPDLGRLYATGDVARIRADGIVEFGGRTDHQVKVRGHRIELGEIESVLDEHPSVVRSVVVAGGEGAATLHAFVMIQQDAPVEPTELRAHVADRLPAVMVPSAIGILDEIPLTPNGKIDRKRLPSDVAALPSPAEPGAGVDDGSTEAMVAAKWSEQLGLMPGRDDNFFEIGGHSLLAVKLFREFGEIAPALVLTDLFRFPTIRTFAAHLDSVMAGGDAGTPAAEPATATGSERGARRRRARARARQGDSD